MVKILCFSFQLVLIHCESILFKVNTSNVNSIFVYTCYLNVLIDAMCNEYALFYLDLCPQVPGLEFYQPAVIGQMFCPGTGP